MGNKNCSIVDELARRKRARFRRIKKDFLKSYKFPVPLFKANETKQKFGQDKISIGERDASCLEL